MVLWILLTLVKSAGLRPSSMALLRTRASQGMPSLDRGREGARKAASGLVSHPNVKVSTLSTRTMCSDAYTKSFIVINFV